MKITRNLRPIISLMAALAFIPMVASAANFTAGNLAAEVCASTSTSSTFSIIELNSATANQASPVQTVTIPSTGANALRQSASSGTTGVLADSSDGTLLVFSAFNDASGVTDETTVLTRGIGTLNNSGNFTLQTTYAGSSGNQTRGATTANNTYWVATDKGGIYTNTANANALNSTAAKSFGGVVYVGSQKTTSGATAIQTFSAGTLTAMSGLPTTEAMLTDFYFLSSQNNGTYDTLYYVTNSGSTTKCGIKKYYLSAGSWVSAGTQTYSSAGYWNLCAATNSSGGANLYLTTGAGGTAANSVILIQDSAAYNATISLGSPTTLYTAAAGTSIKGIAFAPVSYTATYDANGGTGTQTDSSSPYAAGATVTVLGAGGITRTGYTFAGWNTQAGGGGTAFSASSTFSINANTTLYAQWTINTYTISYNGHGNDGGTAPIGGTYNYNTSITVSNQGTLTLSGSSFTGWNTAANGSGTAYGAGSSLTVVSNTTLYAQWASSPSITVTPSTLNFGPVQTNGYYATNSYSVSGANLGANNLVIGSSNLQFQVSSDDVNFSSSLTLTPSGGTVAATTIYVRFSPDSVASYSGIITNTCIGATEKDVAVSGLGASFPTVSTQGATNITTSGAYFNGTVTASNNSAIIDRGFFYKTASGVTISDTRASEGGTAVSAFTKSVTALSPNQIYYYKAYATNALGVTLGAETNFYTLANTPTAPIIGSPTATTLVVTIGSGDGNPSSTTYAIQETNSGNYVQISGALGASAVYQTVSTWGSKTITGLTAGTAYNFQVQAQNGAGTNTAFGPITKASTTALPFTPGNLAVLSPDNGAAADTTFSVLEISASALGQSSPVQTITINGTVANGTELRMGTSGTSGGLSLSSDGTLLCFPGYNTNTTLNTSTLIRGVGTLNNIGAFAMPATYTGISGNQTRSATTVDNQHFFWADKGGVYTNNATSPSDAQNVLRIKSFGGTVYVINQQGFASVVSSVSPDGSRLYAMPGFPTATDANAKDFYLISSGQNGSTYDILYQVDSTVATVGTIYKYSLVSGQWTANGSYSTSFGGCGICAAKSGNQAVLYVVTGLGTAAGNSIEKLTDTAGYNADIAITDNGTLYTAPGATSFKSVVFTPVSYTVTYNGNGNTGGNVPVDSANYGAGAAVTVLGNTNNLSKNPNVFGGWNTSANGSGVNIGNGMEFTITSNTTFYAQWVPVNAAITNTVEITSNVTNTIDATQAPFNGITPPYGYQWYFGSTPLANQTNASLILTNVQFANSGNYSVVVSNTSGFLPVITNLMEVLTVVDTHPPVLNLPSTINVTNGSGGIQVYYTPTATDAGTPGVSVVCSPASGSYFSPGISLVSCYATDDSGNTANGSFLVNVINTNATTNIVVNGRIYLPYSTNLAVGTWVWIDADPTNGSPMRATQRLLGEREVMEKGLFFAGVAFTQVTPTTTGNTVTYDYSAQSGKNTYTVGQLVNKYDPIVIGPDGLAYITDGHHTMAAYLLTNSPVHDIIPGYHRVCFGQIVENFAGQSSISDSWWLARQAENNAYLYGTNGDQLIFPGEPNYVNSQPVLPSVVPMPTTPSNVTNENNIAMIDDNGRSLGWGVRQGIVPSAYDSGGNPIVGYANTAPDGSAINFVDFFWGDFFRNRVVWNNGLTPTGNGDANAINAPLSFFAASANGIALAKSELYRDQDGRRLMDYTNLVTYINATTNANTVAWAKSAIGNGLAVAGDTYNLYLRDDSTIAGDIIPSALSTNILHIDTVAGMTVTQLVQNVKYLYLNAGAKLTTIFPDNFVTNSTLTFPAGSGEVWLNNTSYVSSASVISNGICSVNGVLNSPLLTVANGSTLHGNGTINGTVSVQSSATLSPGNSIGVLTVNGDLTLSGTTAMEINESGSVLTNDLVTGVTNLTFGGTLTVSASGDSLTGGESFTLFSASHYSGTFAATNLPALGANLHWDLSQLAVNGTIRVLGVGPVAGDANYTRSSGVTLLIKVSDLLTNVTDVNGWSVGLTGVGTDGLNLLTTNGTTLFNNGTYIVYTNSVISGVNDAFQYTVSDEHGSTNSGTVFITFNNSTTNLVGQSNAKLVVNGSTVKASFSGVPGYRYTVDRSTNSPSYGWVPISTNIAPANTVIQITDNFQDLGFVVPNSAYYRLRYNP